MAAPASLYTPLRMIRQALKDCGRLQTGEEPKGEVLADALERINDLINFWQTQGLKLWLNSVQSITPVAGTALYTLGPAGSIVTVKPTRVIEGWRVTSTGQRTPLTSLSWNEYHRLGNLTTPGYTNSYFVDKQAANLMVRFWPVPDTAVATGTLELLLQTQATAPTELDETISFPVEWDLALRWALADELSSGQPAIIMERCAGKAASYRQALEDWDVEDTPTRFQPDSLASGLQPSRFR